MVLTAEKEAGDVRKRHQQGEAIASSPTMETRTEQAGGGMEGGAIAGFAAPHAAQQAARGRNGCIML